jgi:hypothetical protein
LLVVITLLYPTAIPLLSSENLIEFKRVFIPEVDTDQFIPPFIVFKINPLSPAANPKFLLIKFTEYRDRTVPLSNCSHD